MCFVVVASKAAASLCDNSIWGKYYFQSMFLILPSHSKNSKSVLASFHLKKGRAGLQENQKSYHHMLQNQRTFTCKLSAPSQRQLV
ncbi:unnamed protein product [Citrullus colocynthis]|uniref:Secreted protein n=1 Tax=Citrullus colocynthis TaxID=252529 RepID=A0ABP0Y2N0_9ROSI